MTDRPPVSGEPPMGADKRRWERDPEYRASLFPEPCLSCENSVARHCPECRACPTGPSSFDCTCRPPVSGEPICQRDDAGQPCGRHLVNDECPLHGRAAWPNPDACCLRNAFEDDAHSRSCPSWSRPPVSGEPLEGTDRIYAAMEKGARTAWAARPPVSGEPPTNIAGGPLLGPHDGGCSCWPHVSQQDAVRAVEHAALIEYRSQRASTGAALDVERLAHGVHVALGHHANDDVTSCEAGFLDQRYAKAIATEYARLAEQEGERS